ncbi:flagellar basal body-associated protein FliL [Nereida ignava]|uniref:Flagellar protein FliL n=1 Tax=Nereida ignava TaxID=282199 RepID=A0A0U1NN08_9RHOB|nr:flagellar basal body-associated FliL family protein [Nereida ignava]CRK76124.1 flagellar basal body-associated protein FliL [Nereida ignava]SFJ56645.1 flagellar FliL protein [Nereida ignava DSM 16309]
MSDETEEPKKKSGLVKILGFVFAGILLIGIGLGAGFFLFGGSSLTPSDEIEQIIERKLKESGQLPEDEEAEEDAEGEGEPRPNIKEVPETDAFVTTYFEFDGNFTTNLRNSRKFLQVGVGVSTQYDESVIEHVETHQLALRSEILGVASEFSEEDIQGKAGRDLLAARMTEAINAKLVLLEGFGGIENVHFTSFMLQ